MSFDTSRFRFDPWKNYSGVVMEQGRVQLDSDWNEWLAQLNRRIQAGTLDIMGRAAYPATTPFAFLIASTAQASSPSVPEECTSTACWPRIMATQRPPCGTPLWPKCRTRPSLRRRRKPARSASLHQPWIARRRVQPTDGGTYLAYLDVWTRAVDYLQDPYLIDPAVGIDTTGRLQTVWQVRLAQSTQASTCGNAGTPVARSLEWPAYYRACQLHPLQAPAASPSNTGYTGAENQNYRVEIHTPGPIGTATFKWSRDNGSVETGVTGIEPVTNSVLVAASQLSVLSMGRDQVLGFAPGDWIEILDDDLELAGRPGEMHRIDTIDFAGKTITLDSPADATKFPVTGGTTPYQTDPARHTRIRRWDQSGKVYQSDGTTVVIDLGAAGSKGEIPVTTSGIAVILENGVTVSFDVSTAAGSFNSGDYWTFAARTDGSLDQLSAAAPWGIHHHYTPLSVVNFATGQASDCRPPLGSGGQNACCCCSVTVGAGAQYQSINDALAALPASGGEVCILPGRYFEHVFINGLQNVVIRGCGYQTRLASPSLAPPAALSAASVAAGATTGGNSDGTFNAVISISGSQHIELRDFAVEADTNEVGILVDGTGKLVAPPPGTDNPGNPNQTTQEKISLIHFNLPRVIDVTIKDLFLTGSTLPAILARSLSCFASMTTGSLWRTYPASGRRFTCLGSRCTSTATTSASRAWRRCANGYPQR